MIRSSHGKAVITPPLVEQPHVPITHAPPQKLGIKNPSSPEPAALKAQKINSLDSSSMDRLQGHTVDSLSMTEATILETPEPDQNKTDPAAVFACALSLQRKFSELEIADPTFIISESYNGYDQFMREIMRVAGLFEAWAVTHVLFEEMERVWPYLLETDFAEACLKTKDPGELSGFNESDCLTAARHLKLPLHGGRGLRIPLNLRRQNPLSSSRFESYQILSVSEDLKAKQIHPIERLDDLTDENFGKLFYGLYGIDADGEAEHISDRESYPEARSLVRALVPGIDFPEYPAFLPEKGSK